MRARCWIGAALLLLPAPAAAQVTERTLAGGGPDGLPAASASVWAGGVAVGPNGEAYVSSDSDGRIYRIDTAGNLFPLSGRSARDPLALTQPAALP